MAAQDKLPDAPLLMFKVHRSFDCVESFAGEWFNFAQDDRL